MDNKLSNEFINAICDSGSVETECGFCHKTIFASLTPGYYEDGELERLKIRATNKPDDYEEWPGCDAVVFGTLNGINIVPGCSIECDDKIYQYEKFVTENRYKITDFLKNRAAKIKEDSKLDAEMTTL